MSSDFLGGPNPDLSDPYKRLAYRVVMASGASRESDEETGNEGEEKQMAVCPMFSTETKDKECKNNDCAWFQPSAAAGSGQCAVLSLSTSLRTIANNPK